eukprot:51164-Eustigmatos_ZCMA.PRE.1
MAIDVWHDQIGKNFSNSQSEKIRQSMKKKRKQVIEKQRKAEKKQKPEKQTDASLLARIAELEAK